MRVFVTPAIKRSRSYLVSVYEKNRCKHLVPCTCLARNNFGMLDRLVVISSECLQYLPVRPAGESEPSRVSILRIIGAAHLFGKKHTWCTGSPGMPTPCLGSSCIYRFGRENPSGPGRMRSGCRTRHESIIQSIFTAGYYVHLSLQQ